LSLPFAALLWLHIVSAVGWLGAGMVFAMLIGPILPTLSPSSRGELIVRLFPKYVRWAEIFTFVTPVFGLTLALYISHGDWSIFDPNSNTGIACTSVLVSCVTNPFGFYLSIGALLTLVAWGLVFGVVAPTGRRIVWFTQAAMKNPGNPPPAGLAKATMRLRASSSAGLVLLLVIVLCMVLAAT
jgi:hypothetical protein